MGPPLFLFSSLWLPHRLLGSSLDRVALLLLLNSSLWGCLLAGRSGSCLLLDRSLRGLGGDDFLGDGCTADCLLGSSGSCKTSGDELADGDHGLVGGEGLEGIEAGGTGENTAPQSKHFWIGWGVGWGEAVW